MTTPVYPSNLPAPSNFSSVTFAPYANNIQVTSMTAGEPKRRKLFTYIPKVMTCSLRLTQAQVTALETFYANTCNCVNSFVWKDWLHDSTANQTYAFLQEPAYAYVQDSKGSYFDTTLNLLAVKS